MIVKNVVSFNIKDKRCITCNLKIPNFNYPNEKQALFCNDCKQCGMVNIVDKKCINCNLKQPTFNYSNEQKALYCASCKLVDMIDILNKNVLYVI